MLKFAKEKIILASSSRVRKQILNEVCLKFEVISPICDEEELKQEFCKNKNYKIKDLAIFLASKKALSVSEKYPTSYVIGSDQVCEFEGKEISKSNNEQEAIFQLSKFIKKTHTQNNATVIAFNGKIIFKNYSKSTLTMQNLTLQQIESYVKYDKPWGCAGSYKYESMGKHLFTKVTGDYYSILGLAIQPLLEFFHKKQIIQI